VEENGGRKMQIFLGAEGRGSHETSARGQRRVEVMYRNRIIVILRFYP
jgi:hypothetical protein